MADWNSDDLKGVHEDLINISNTGKDREGNKVNVADLCDHLAYLCEVLDGYFGYLEGIKIKDTKTELMGHIRDHRHMPNGEVVEAI